jgi:hypothetical protein
MNQEPKIFGHDPSLFGSDNPFIVASFGFKIHERKKYDNPKKLLNQVCRVGSFIRRRYNLENTIFECSFGYDKLDILNQQMSLCINFKVGVKALKSIK